MAGAGPGPNGSRNVWAEGGAIVCSHLGEMFINLRSLFVREAGIDLGMQATTAIPVRTEAGPSHSGGQTAKSKGKVKKEKGHREPSAYNLFMKDHFPVVRAENPGATNPELLRKIAVDWAHAPSNPKNQGGSSKPGGAQGEANHPVSPVVEDHVPAEVPKSEEKKRKKHKRFSEDDVEPQSGQKRKEVEDEADSQMAKKEKKRKKKTEAEA